MVLQYERLKSAVFAENCHLLIVKGAAEYIACGGDVCIHEARDRADCRRWGWEDANPRG
jgi:hypothetical protein